jgi:hypothetical protein
MLAHHRQLKEICAISKAATTIQIASTIPAPIRPNVFVYAVPCLALAVHSANTPGGMVRITRAIPNGIKIRSSK